MAQAVSIPEAPAQPSDPPIPPPAPARVLVRARQHLGEMVDGEMMRFAPGDTFEMDADRARAIGDLVERVD